MNFRGDVFEDFVCLWAFDQFHQAAVPDAGSVVCFSGDGRVARTVHEDMSNCLWRDAITDACGAVHDVEPFKVTAEAAMTREELCLYEVSVDVIRDPHW